MFDPEMADHLIFFDAECPFCCRAVKHVLEIDVNQRFLFAPLNGETAAEVLTGPQRPLAFANSLVLAENFRSTERRFWIRSRAICRIHWLAGNGWGLIGIFSFLPNWIGDFFYNWLAAHRHQFKLKMPGELGPRERFLK